MLNKRSLKIKIEKCLSECHSILGCLGGTVLGRENAKELITEAHMNIFKYVNETMLEIPREHDYNPVALVMAEGILISRKARAKCIEADICPDCAVPLFGDSSEYAQIDYRCPQCKVVHYSVDDEGGE